MWVIDCDCWCDTDDGHDDIDVSWYDDDNGDDHDFCGDNDDDVWLMWRVMVYHFNCHLVTITKLHIIIPYMMHYVIYVSFTT